jgi:predicted permease
VIDRLRSLLNALFRRGRFEEDMADELRFHIDAYADDLERSGVPRAEARRRARLEFGGVEGIREDCRQARGLRLLDELRQDLRYAGRLMAKTPGFTAAAILSLALGIGANVAIFSLMDALLVKLIPVAEPQQLYFLAHGRERVSTSSNYPLLEGYRALSSQFSGVTAFAVKGMKVSTPAGIELVNGQLASGNYHAVLGVPFVLGRGFAAEPDRPADESFIAVISESYWQRRYGGSPDVIGKTLVVNGRTVAIVGVTAAGFHGLVPGTRLDITLPLSHRVLEEPDFLTERGNWTSMPIVGRLAAGVSDVEAQSAVETVFQRYMSEPSNQWIKQLPGDSFVASTLLPAGKGSATLRRQYGKPVGLLMAMVCVVLLIACANVANLLLARAAAREKEVAIRLGIGAGRGRLVRQFLTESALLALCGGGLGLLIATWGAGWILSLLDAGPSPVFLDASPNARVILFTGAISLLTGIGFGLAPALKASRVDVAPALKESGNRFLVGGRRWATGKALVAGQIALCVLLLSGAGLIVRSIHKLKSQDAGFRKENVLLFSLDTEGTAFPLASRPRWPQELVDRLRAMPGVVSVSGSTLSPIGTTVELRLLRLPGLPATPLEPRSVWVNNVTIGYFETLGISLLRGRTFTAIDGATAPKVAILNETAARFYFGKTDPVGQELGFGDTSRGITIVGVARDARQETLRALPPRMVYTPLAQRDEPPDSLVAAVRTANDPRSLAGTVRATVGAFSKDLVVDYVRTMEQQLDSSLLREHLLARLGTSFGLLALVLAVVGLFGVMSYDVVRRTREIGIRIALGADPSMLAKQILREIALLAASGVVLGLAAALATTHLMSVFLFGVTPRDPLTLGAATALLLTSALVAGYLPARRAARVDPIRALKTE